MIIFPTLSYLLCFFIYCVPIYLNTQTASSLMVQIFKLYVPLLIDYTLIPIGVYISRHLERCIHMLP